MNDLVVSAAIAVVTLALMVAGSRLRRRFASGSVVARLGGTRDERVRSARRPILAGAAEVIQGWEMGRRLAHHAARAYPTVGFSDALAWLASGAIGGGLLGWLLFVSGPPALLSAICGSILADRLLARHGGRRSHRIEQQLPEALFVQASALRAGNSLTGSLRAVASELSDPLGEDMGSLLREIDLGVPLEQGLEELAVRVGGRDFELWVTAMLVHRQTGGNLAAVVEALAERIRERADMRAELRAMTAQGRLSGVVVAVAPLVFFGVLSVTSRDQMTILYSTPLGIAVLLTGLLMQGVGFLWIRRILRINP